MLRSDLFISNMKTPFAELLIFTGQEVYFYVVIIKEIVA
jgi:hypothetical protein